MLELCTVECTQSYLCTLKAFPTYTNLVVATSAYTRIGKNTKRRDDFEKYLEKQLKDPEYREEYEKLEPLYTLIKLEIKLRNKRHLSQKELAERMGTSQSAIARFERGNINPTLDFAVRLAKALNAKLAVGFK